MITPEAIRGKAKRLFPPAVNAWIKGDEFFPRRVPADLQPPRGLAEAAAAVDELRNGERTHRGIGYRIEWTTRSSRTHGTNDFPTAIYIDSMDDLAELAGETASWKSLESAVPKVRGALPQLEAWLCEGRNWKHLIATEKDLSGLLDLICYLLKHPRSGLFARQIPVAASTKLLETHRRLLSDWLDRLLPADQIDFRFSPKQFEPRYGLRYAEPHFLLRCLDTAIGEKIGIPFAECSLPVSELNRLQVDDAVVLLVENKINVLTLPPLERGLVLGGLGNGVIQLAAIRWLKDRRVFYWGDLDSAGFEILARLREQIGGVESFLMDRATLQTHRQLLTQVAQRPPGPTDFLTPHETELYRQVCEQGLRLEQEHISETICNEAMEMIRQSTRR